MSQGRMGCSFQTAAKKIEVRAGIRAAAFAATAGSMGDYMI